MVKQKTDLDKQLEQSVKDFEKFPEWKKKFYNEVNNIE